MSYDSTKSFIQHEDREVYWDASFLKQLPADCMKGTQCVKETNCDRSSSPWSSNISSPALKYFGTTHELPLLSKDPEKPI